MGISHLLEHMVFKGTERRSAKQLALELEVRGGSLDAFTGRDYTSYQAHILDADLAARGRDPHRPRPPAAAPGERSRVRAQRHPRGDQRGRGHARRPRLRAARRRAVARATRTATRFSGARERWRRSRRTTSVASTRRGYYRGNFVVAAAGNVDHAQLLTVLEREGWFEGASAEPPRGAGRARARGARRPPPRGTRHGADPHRLRHRHLSAARPAALRAGDPDQRVRRRACPAALFQRVREELGLAYAVFAYKHFYQSRRAARRLHRHPARERRRGGGRPSRRSTPGSPAKGCRRTSWRTASSSSRARSCCRSRARGPAWVGSRASCCTTTNTGRSIRCWRRSMRSPPDEIAEVAAEYFAPERQTTCVTGWGPRSGEGRVMKCRVILGEAVAMSGYGRPSLAQ